MLENGSSYRLTAIDMEDYYSPGSRKPSQDPADSDSGSEEHRQQLTQIINEHQRLANLVIEQWPT